MAGPGPLHRGITSQPTNDPWAPQDDHFGCSPSGAVNNGEGRDHAGVSVARNAAIHPVGARFLDHESPGDRLAWLGVSNSQVAGCDGVVLVAMPLILGYDVRPGALDDEVVVDRLLGGEP